MSGDEVSANLKVRRNDANNTWIACVELPDGHRVHSENMDRYTAIENVKKLARHHANTTTTKPKDISELRPIIQDQIARQEKAMFEAVAVTNIQIEPDEYQVDTCTMVTTKQTNGHYKCVLTPLGHSAGYVGYSPSKIGSEVEAVKSYRKHNDTRNSQPKVEPNTLASDMFEQEKVMAGLIEKAKRTGLDHRLIAMANTDFERGFMALDKALTTNIG